MAKITTLQLNKSKKKVTVFLDDLSSFTIDKTIAEDVGLRKGVDLSEERLKQLLEVELYRRCYEIGLRFLAYCPRSEREIQQRLHRRGFDDAVVNKVLVKLRKENLINDAAFAQSWKDSRLSSNPKSRRMVKYELMRKGVSSEAVDKAIGDMDDTANAYKAGLRKARLLSSLSYSEFRRRMESYLKWRGFSYDVINVISERLWQEKQNVKE